MRRLGRKLSLREQVARNVAALEQFGASGELPDDLKLSLSRLPLPKRRQTATNIDRVHRAETAGRVLEAHVIRAVEGLLAVHPRVLFVLRQNAGGASYENKSGKYAPVFFHRWVRPGSGFRMSDFMGATTDCRILALEAKRPGFRGPSDQREREQAAFLDCVRKNGGRAGFVTSADEAQTIIEN